MVWSPAPLKGENTCSKINHNFLTQLYGKAVMTTQTLTTKTIKSLEQLRSTGSVRRGNIIVVNKGRERMEAGGTKQ
jgi:hypothetical protein